MLLQLPYLCPPTLPLVPLPSPALGWAFAALREVGSFGVVDGCLGKTWGKLGEYTLPVCVCMFSPKKSGVGGGFAQVDKCEVKAQ